MRNLQLSDPNFNPNPNPNSDLDNEPNPDPKHNLTLILDIAKSRSSFCKLSRLTNCTQHYNPRLHAV